MKYVIVGDGIAGVSAIEAIRRVDRAGSITLVSRENDGPYARCLIAGVIAGERSNMSLRPPGFLRDLRVEVLGGAEATELDPRKKTLALDDGRVRSFDRLLLATGSRPAFPPVKGIDLTGVFALRTWEDARQIAALAEDARHATVVGAGPVGLEAAEALAALGVKVSLVEKAPRLLPLQLDEPAAGQLQSAVEEAGVDVICGGGLAEIIGRAGFVAGIMLEDNRVIPADLVVVATGVKANASLAVGTDLKVGRGFIVNSRMETNLPGIYAAGDAAEITDCVSAERLPSGLWPAAARMGTVAGQNMAGGSSRPELPPMAAMKNSVELFGIRAISVGMVNPPVNGNYEEHVVRMPGGYRKAVTHGDRLVGAIFLGDTGGAGIASAFIESGKPLPVPASHLLRRLSAAEFVRMEGRALDRYLNVS